MTEIKKMDDSKISVIINGEEVECDVLFEYSSEDYDDVFVGYTDNTYDVEGNLNIYASKYNPNYPNKLNEVTDYQERQLVNSVIEEIINNNK